MESRERGRRQRTRKVMLAAFKNDRAACNGERDLMYLHLQVFDGERRGVG
jgi:hypothetical protein